MVVNVVKKADTGSNQPGKFAVQLTAQAYSYKRPTGFAVSVLRPKIDRLSFTYEPLGEASRDKLAAQIAKICDQPSSPLSVWQKRKNWGSSKYAASIAVNLGMPANCLLQHASLHSSLNFLRLELGGGAISSDSMKALADLLSTVSDGAITFESVALNCKVTRTDVAVDLVNIDIEDMLITGNKPGVSMGYFGIGGKAESKYLNVKKKGSNLYVYDRKVSLEKLKAKGKSEGSEYGDTVYTRVEFRLHPDRPITELGTLKHNPFKRVHLIDIESLSPPEETHHWKLFQDSCRYRGLENALELLPPDTRKTYEDAISASTIALWRPDLLWGMWPDSLKDGGLVI